MRETLIKNGERYVEVEVDGREYLIRFSDDKYYYKKRLKNSDSAFLLEISIAAISLILHEKTRKPKKWRFEYVDEDDVNE